MNRIAIEILVGLGVLGVAGALHHQISRLQAETADMRGIVEQSASEVEPAEELARMRRDLTRMVDDRLGVLERRLAQTSENVREASFLSQEVELARQEAALIKAEISRDVSLTREMVENFRAEARSREESYRWRTERTASELERLAGRMEPNPESLTHELLLPTVQLNGSDTVGSGTLVRSDRDSATGETHNYVLTAYHVVRNILADTPRARTEGIAVTVYRRSGRIDVKGFLVASDKDLDCAVVRLKTDEIFEDIAYVLPRDQAEKVEVWADIYAIGCPLGNDPIPTRGSISSTQNVLNGTNYWMISAPTYYGNSGGGVFLAEQRCLIGVFSKIYTHGRGNPIVVPHMGLCTPITSIYDWLEREKLADVIPAGTLRSTLSVDAEFGIAAPSK